MPPLVAIGLVAGALAFAASAGGDTTGPIPSARGLIDWGAGTPVATMPQSPGSPGTTFLAVADFNGDGLPDILGTQSQWHSGTLYTPEVFVNNGHGGFDNQTSSIFSGAPPLTMDPRRVIVADFNGDGRSDVFMGDQGPDLDLQGYHNTLILSAPGGKLVDATGNLPPQVDEVQVDALHGAAVGDLNGDGAPDIFLGEMGGETDNGVLLNDGTGHFYREPNSIPPVYLGHCSVILAVAIADLNGDGWPDAVVGGGTNPCQPVPTGVLLNDGHGRFPTLITLPKPPYGFDTPTDIAVGDLNGDGTPDIVIGYSKESFSGLWLQIDLNDGHGNFSDGTADLLPPQSDNDTPAYFNWIRLVDLNGDGHLDIATGLATGGTHTSPYYLNDGTGHFTALPDQLGFDPIDTSTIADLGGDRGLDLVYGGDPIISVAHARPQPQGTLYATLGPGDYFSFLNEAGSEVLKPKPGVHKVIVWDRSPTRYLTLHGPGVSETSEYATGIEYWYVVFKRKAKYTISLTSPTADYTFRTGARRRR